MIPCVSYPVTKKGLSNESITHVADRNTYSRHYYFVADSVNIKKGKNNEPDYLSRRTNCDCNGHPVIYRLGIREEQI